MLEGVSVSITFKPLETAKGQILQHLSKYPEVTTPATIPSLDLYLYPGGFSPDYWSHLEIHTSITGPFMNQAFTPYGDPFVPLLPFSKVKKWPFTPENCQEPGIY